MAEKEAPKQLKSTISQWLEHLQQNSWELELIISGLAIFGLIQFGEHINESLLYLSANQGSDTLSIVRVFILLLGSIGIKIFIFNLIVHLFVRGLWIGAVGLRYVSGDYNFDKLNYSKPIIDFYKRSIGSFDRFIEKLENLASVIFSFTFLLFFIAASATIFGLAAGAVIFLVDDVLQLPRSNVIHLIFRRIALITAVMGGLVAVDFLTLGLLKRIKQRHFARFFYWIYRYVGWISLSFIWRPLLLNFLDNSYTRKLIWLIVPYFIIISLNTYELADTPHRLYPVIGLTETFSPFDEYQQEIARESILNYFYDDLRTRDQRFNEFPINYLSLSAYKCDDKGLEVFVKYDQSMEAALLKIDTSLYFVRKGIIQRLVNKEKKSILKKIKKDNSELDDKISRLKKEKKGLDMTTDSIRIIQIRDEIREVEGQMKDYGITAYRSNLERINRVSQNAFSFEIDGQGVGRSTYYCNYYTHPNAGELGWLCFLPTDSLSRGRHLLRFDRVTLNFEETIDTMTIEIPFIRI